MSLGTFLLESGWISVAGRFDQIYSTNARIGIWNYEVEMFTHPRGKFVKSISAWHSALGHTKPTLPLVFGKDIWANGILSVNDSNDRSDKVTGSLPGTGYATVAFPHRVYCTTGLPHTPNIYWVMDHRGSTRHEIATRQRFPNDVDYVHVNFIRDEDVKMFEKSSS